MEKLALRRGFTRCSTRNVFSGIKVVDDVIYQLARYIDLGIEPPNK